jgi:predicted pyridoxine 5'-phosphate oxidase superfamily flavin-nucleotide-binding protein
MDFIDFWGMKPRIKIGSIVKVIRETHYLKDDSRNRLGQIGKVTRINVKRNLFPFDVEFDNEEKEIYSEKELEVIN